MAEAQSGKSKPVRIRSACTACRSNKQKCDGATRQPCRRCELYSLPCEFPGVNLARAAESASASGPMEHRPTTSIARVASVAPSAFATLNEIVTRLKSIELGLEKDRRMYSRGGGRSGSQVAFLSPMNDSGHDRDGSGPSPLPQATDFQTEEAEGLNPVRLVSESPVGISALDMNDSASYSASIPSLNRDPHPDVVLRGLVTTQDCEAAFRFYHTNIQPWLMGDSLRHNYLTLQVASPILFHVILLATSCEWRDTRRTNNAHSKLIADYSKEGMAQSQEVFEGLTSIVNELIAEIVLATNPSRFDITTVIALSLLLCYRPIQYTVYASRGVLDLSSIELASKSNALSSAMLQGLLDQSASFLRMQMAPAVFLQSLWTSSPDADKARKAVQDLRLWYWLLMLDVHGSLQSGRRITRDAKDALRTTRTFIALKADVRDPRRAALVELYSIVAPYTALIASVKINSAELTRINQELDDWEAHWRPILMEAQLSGDKIAYTAIQDNAQFIRVSVNIAVYHRWTAARKKSLSEGGNGRPILTRADWDHLGRAVTAAERMLFTLSEESESSLTPLKSYDWPTAFDGNIEPLHLSPTAVADHRCSLDTVACVTFIYAALMLIRMASNGLVSCSITPKQAEYEAGLEDLNRPQALTPGRKMPCILELAAAFLDSMAPRSHHPAKKHSILLRLIRQAGLGNITPHDFFSPDSAHSNNTSTSIPAPFVSPQNEPWIPPSAPIDYSFLDDDMEATKLFPISDRSNSTSPPGPAMASLLRNIDPSFLDDYEYQNAAAPSAPERSSSHDMDMDSFDWETLQRQMEVAPPIDIDWSI